MWQKSAGRQNVVDVMTKHHDLHILKALLAPCGILGDALATMGRQKPAHAYHAAFDIICCSSFRMARLDIVRRLG